MPAIVGAASVPGMEFSEVIAARRMVRNYTEEPVDREAVERILDAGRRAPSAGFSQGHAFVVVVDKADRSTIAELANEPDYVAAGLDPWISSAPVHIVVCVSEAAYHRRYKESDKLQDGDEIVWPIPYWWVDSGAAMENILLAVVDEGLAAGFLGVHAIPGLKDLLEIPEEYTPIGIVTVGHGAVDRKSASLGRGHRKRHHVVHWNRWDPEWSPDF